MKTILTGLFSTPIVDEEYRTQQARTLKLVIIFITGLSGPYLLINSISDPENIGRYLAQTVFIIASGSFNLWLVYKRHLRTVAIIQIGSTWLLFTLAAYTGGGVLSSAYMGYAAVLVIANLLAMRRWEAFVTTGLCLISGYVFVELEARGLLPPSRVPVTAISIWRDSFVFFMLITGLQNFAGQFARNAQERMRAEIQERRKAEATLQLALDAAHLASWSVELPERKTEYSARYLELNGGVKGENFENIHPDDRPAVIQTITEMIAGQREGFVLTHRLVWPDGTIRWTESWGRLTRNEKGEPVKMGGVMFDITERKLAEEKEKRRSALLETVIELGKEITQVNELEACLRKIHHGIRQGLGFDRLGLFLLDDNQENLRGAYGTSETGEIEDTSWFVQKIEEYPAWKTVFTSPEGLSLIHDYQQVHPDLPKDSEMRRVQEHVTLAAWAGQTPVALISVDNAISQRSITDEQVEALRLFAGYAGLAIVNARNNEALEKRVKERTQQLERANQEMEAFSYSVSHDLRAPLRGIVGFTEILQRDFSHELGEEAQRFLGKIAQNGTQMGLLIDKLLEFARLGRQALKLQPVQPGELIQYIIAELKLEIGERQINWLINPLPGCRADAVLLRNVWANLLSNAVKYTATRQTAEIEIGCLKQLGENVYYVRDNGVGFDMTYAGKLFGVFQRMHRQDEFEGSGVGLATVQRIILRHGGRIWFEARPNQGATFYFTLNRNPPIS